MNLIYNRPFLYKKQYDFVNDLNRFVACEASTKSGKTLGCIVWIYEQCILPERKQGDNVWWIAPVYKQTEIAYNRLKNYIPKDIATTNESSLLFKFFNGVVLSFKTGDHPDNLYGDDVVACVIDEASRVKEASWWAIRSTLTATRGRCRFIGNIKGVSNWFYKLCRNAESGKLNDWNYHKITSLDAVQAGVFSQQELDEARAVLPEEIFNELYLCIPFDDRGKPFFWAFDYEKNTIDSYEINKQLPVYLSFDFNVDPICCIASQHEDFDWAVTFKEFRLANSNIYELCERIKTELLQNMDYVINGDASGMSRSALTKNLNYYQIIHNELFVSKNNFNIPNANPGIDNTRTLTNSLFAKHPSKKIVKCCRYLIDDLRFVQTKEDGSIDKSTGSMTHLGDCLRYYDFANFAKFLKTY